MSTNRIRWGLLSTGRMAGWFADDFPYVSNGELAAVASKSAASAKSFANRYNIPRYYGDYGDMLADPDVDVIYIGTPHTAHYRNALDALRAGKAVVCEKPMTVNPEECRLLMQEADATDGYLMEAMWTFFLPAIQKAREWVADGRIGRLCHVKADFGYPQLPYHPQKREYDPELGGGALLEMGVYPVALAHLFMGLDPLDIQVTCQKAPNGVEDDVVAVLSYGEQTATLATSFRCKLQNWAYLIGDAGYIAIPDFWRAGRCTLYRLDEKIAEFVDDRASQGFCFEAEQVGRDLLAGRRQSEIMPLEHSLSIQEHMDRIRRLF